MLVDKAITIYKNKARDDDLGLAMALHSRSRYLAQLEQLDQALPLIERAASIYRDKRQANSTSGLLYDLGLTLNNQSMYLAQLGRLDDALAIVEEAVLLHRDLADYQPEAFLPNFVVSLRIKSSYLTRRGRVEEALVVINEAVDVCRQLPTEVSMVISVQPSRVLEEQAAIASTLERRADMEGGTL